MNRLTLNILGLTLLISSTSIMAQNQMTSEESNPKIIGWMQGFPPTKDKILSAADGSAFSFPGFRYTASHMREFLPTKNVMAAQNNRYLFEENIDPKIENINFLPIGQQKKMSWKESLEKNYTDGIIILHKGKIVYENYDGALDQNGTHAVMSVSKSLVGTLASKLIVEGVLDESKLGKDYLPEIANSAFGDARLREILDMTTSLQYSEDYADPKADIWAFSAAGNPFPKPKEYNGPTNYYEYLKTVKENKNHGEIFGYKTINTDALGWIISKVTGKSIPELLSEKIWQPLGTHHDGYYQIDGAGIAFAGGGFNANLRDLAMFGEMMRNNGYFNGQQIIPKQTIDDIKKGGDKNAFAKAGYTTLSGWSYRNMWWVSHNPDEAFAARGVYGQTIYIDPKAEMVIVRLASNPIASNTSNDPISLPAYQAIADYLMKK